MAPLKVCLAQGRHLWCKGLLLCALLMLHWPDKCIRWLACSTGAYSSIPEGESAPLRKGLQQVQHQLEECSWRRHL